MTTTEHLDSHSDFPANITRSSSPSSAQSLLCALACTHARMHACTHARMHACTHARMHACTHARVCVYVHAQTCAPSFLIISLQGGGTCRCQRERLPSVAHCQGAATGVTPVCVYAHAHAAHTHTHTHSLSLSLSHTHAHTRMHAHMQPATYALTEERTNGSSARDQAPGRRRQ